MPMLTTMKLTLLSSVYRDNGSQNNQLSTVTADMAGNEDLDVQESSEYKSTQGTVESRSTEYYSCFSEIVTTTGPGTISQLWECPDLHLHTVKLTGKTLGCGSYGCVEEVEVASTLCAAKKIHDFQQRKIPGGWQRMWLTLMFPNSYLSAK